MQYSSYSKVPDYRRRPPSVTYVVIILVDIVSSGSEIHLECSPTGAETRSRSRVPATRASSMISFEFPFNKTASQTSVPALYSCRSCHDGVTLLYEEDIVVVVDVLLLARLLYCSPTRARALMLGSKREPG